MSTQPQIPATPPKPPGEVEIKIYHHSNLFYWWPVWAVGFLLGVLSLSPISRHNMLVVPKGTTAEHEMDVLIDKTVRSRDVYVLPEGESVRLDEDTKKPVQPHLDTSATKNYGVLFAVVLLLVIVITNVPLRGMWSVVIIITVVLLSVIFALAKIWDRIFGWFSLLDIHINAGGYFFIATVLFVIWLFAVLFFDRQMYMVFTPGQFRVCQEIGGGEKAFDTAGMTLEKQRSDLFRHWILGLGSGDMVVKTARGDHFDLHNVLFVGRKVAMIEDMLRERAVVRGR